jgi:hypothetical protein
MVWGVLRNFVIQKKFLELIDILQLEAFCEPL